MSQGVSGQLFLPSSVLPRWPTCSSAAVCVPFALGGLLSREIITLLLLAHQIASHPAFALVHVRERVPL